MSKRNNYGSCFETCPTGLLGGAGGLNRYRVLIQGLGSEGKTVGSQCREWTSLDGLSGS